MYIFMCNYIFDALTTIKLSADMDLTCDCRFGVSLASNKLLKFNISKWNSQKYSAKYVVKFPYNLQNVQRYKFYRTSYHGTNANALSIG